MAPFVGRHRHTFHLAFILLVGVIALYVLYDRVVGINRMRLG